MPFSIKRLLPLFGDNEKVFLVLREHWLIPTIKISLWLGLIILVMILENFIKTNVPFFTQGQPLIALQIIHSMFLIASLLGLLIVWTMYYLNVQIVTNERIIDVNQKSLSNHSTSELHMEKCQDVKTEITGFFGNFLDYGNVRIQTAAELENFVFENVPHPHEVSKIILELYDKITEGADQKKIANDP